MRNVMLHILPFILGGIIHYTDAWVYIPSAFILGLYWMGCAHSILEEKEKRRREGNKRKGA